MSKPDIEEYIPFISMYKKKKKTRKTILEVRIVIFLHGCLGAWEAGKEWLGGIQEGFRGLVS